MKRKESSAVVYLIFFFVVFLAFCSFAIDATIVYTARAKLQNATEAAALAGASSMTSGIGTTDSTLVKKTANAAFNIFKSDILGRGSANYLSASKAVVEVSLDNKMVKVTATSLCQPYFLAFLGVSGVKLNAVALAVSENLPVTANYASVNWITASAAYLSDVISNPNAKGDGTVTANTNFNDTAILRPVGNFDSSSVDAETGVMHFEYLAKGDSKPLSLGPSGFITIKLPAPIINKPGPDLFIKEAGDSLEGYMVFAGLDVEPTNPYVQYDRAGSGIKWKNISCSGVPEKTDDGNLIGAYDAVTSGLGSQTKFYGSGYFDLGASCVGLSMAKYIRIVDDNDESAIVKNTLAPISNVYYKALMIGESSTITSGADIDYIDVLNHVRLIPPSQWKTDP